jgi:hypothetical protein
MRREVGTAFGSRRPVDRDRIVVAHRAEDDLQIAAGATSDEPEDALGLAWIDVRRWTGRSRISARPTASSS